MIGLMSLKKSWYKNYRMGDSLCTDCGLVVGVVGAGHVTMALYYHSPQKYILQHTALSRMRLINHSDILTSCSSFISGLGKTGTNLKFSTFPDFFDDQSGRNQGL